MTPGFDLRTRAWPLDRVHGRRRLADALELSRAAGPDGAAVAWLDTETTGLAGGTGTYVFLVGIASAGASGISLTQYVLRDLGAEPEMLAAVGEHLRRFDALVTFNGTRFDLPLLATRFLLCRMRTDIDAGSHLDLMTLARRLWHRCLGGYSMGLLEQRLLQVERVIDVPGWMIPSLYVQFLHTGDVDALEPVFAHNEQDILSLVALHGLAGEILARPERAPVAVDWFGLGRLLETRGSRETAADCYGRALEEERDPSVRLRAATALARHYRLTGQLDRLLDLWDREAALAIIPRWQALERLAMIWEWELRDPGRALAHTDRALAALNGAGDQVRARLRRRRERLRSKAAMWSLRGA